MENLQNLGSSIKKSLKNAEMQFVIAPILKSLKMGLESSDWYQIEGLGKLIKKISKILGSFLPKVRYRLDY